MEFKTLGIVTLKVIERFVGWGATYRDAAFYDSAHFPWARKLEIHAGLMKSEAEYVLERFNSLMSLSRLSKYQESVDNDDQWKVFILRGFGTEPQIAQEWCPRTLELLNGVDGLSTAMFSILHPGKRIAPHRGLYKGLSRFHLGLVVPKDSDNCWIRVGDQRRKWSEGVSFVFEDTFEHEVRNDTEEFRVVLLITFERPLRMPFRLINRVVLRLVSYSPYVTDTVARYTAWEKGIRDSQQAGEPSGKERSKDNTLVP